MRISKLLGERIESKPNQALSKGNEYLIRAGFIKQVCNGVYSLLAPCVRVQRKIESIIRDEMNKLDGQEVLMPVMMPRELWEESGRYSSIGQEMFRFKDRTNHDMVLGMTHEEASIHLTKNTVKSYDQLPFMIYQIQTKLRDEARARAGLIRTREFTMKDAYSFHNSREDLEQYYDKMHIAYTNIFRRIGMKNVVSVKSDSGMMGGAVNHEFMLLNPIGEDSIVVCDNCGYRANMEVACSVIEKNKIDEQPLKEINTADAKTIEELCEFLNINSKNICKAVCYFATQSKKYVVAFIRGDLDVNETKLRNTLKEEIVPIEIEEGGELVAGNIGPKNFENVITIYDLSLLDGSFVVGANKTGFHKTGFSFQRDIKVEFNDISKVSDGQLCACCNKGTIKIYKGVEVGQIFQLDTKYTNSMNMTIHNSNGESVNPIMGCYGIGVGRAIACVAEESCDDKGLVWPISIAPYQIYLCPLRIDDEQVQKSCEQVYELLESNGFEVLYDDRNTSAGIKLNDSELMGVPIRIVISPRSLKENCCEIKIRASQKQAVLVKIEELIKNLNIIISEIS